jgi:LAO/AO transport system kinase
VLLDTQQRRELARELSRVANASVEEVIRFQDEFRSTNARRVGITGPPGVGKSTLVGAFAKARAAAGRGVGVLAIDPASPYTQGAVLGDRIRVAEATDDERIFMRSLSSRDANDGMCNNAADLLRVLEGRGFDDVLLETVGVGQAEHAVKTLVDTVVLLLQPETGDAIQALKAGILEVADIIVISKCDLDGAHRMRENVAATVRFGTKKNGSWEVPVVLVSVDADIGLDTLAEYIDAHAAWCDAHRDRRVTERERAAYRLRDLLMRKVDNVLREAQDKLADGDISAAYRWVVDQL